MSPHDEGQPSGRIVHNDSSPTPRARRIPREVLRTRVLDAAEELLAGGGLSVGLHHLNMEELIRRVGVPRSSAFAAFGGKDELLTELMLRLLEPRGEHSLGYSPRTAETVTEVIARYSDRLTDAAGRRDDEAVEQVMREAVRQAIGRNIADTVDSAEWRTYMALSVSVESLPAEQRARVQVALRANETRFLTEIAEVYRQGFEALGRIPVAGTTWLQIAAVGASLIEGLASKRLVGVEGLEATIPRPGIDGAEVDWGLPALAFWSLMMGLTRPAED